VGNITYPGRRHACPPQRMHFLNVELKIMIVVVVIVIMKAMAA
jgi:hypothetical protein